MGWRGVCSLLVVSVALGAAAVAEGAPAPSLELKLDAPQDVPAAGPGGRVTGDFGPAPDGKPALGLGRSLGPTLPAAPFCGPAAGWQARRPGLAASGLLRHTARCDHARPVPVLPRQPPAALP